VLVRFIHDFQAFGRESVRQFLCDPIFRGHDDGISQRRPPASMTTGAHEANKGVIVVVKA
jgi:hypothetical protein